MKKKAYLIAIALLLLMLVAAAQAETNEQLIHFWNLPFKNVTEKQVTQILKDQHDVLLEEYPVIDFYGYPMELFVNFAPDGHSIERIYLADAEEPFASQEEFHNLSLRDVEIFVDLDKRFTEMYGEPDYRFFSSGMYGMPYTENERTMFADGQWTEERLMHVFDQDDRMLRAFSIWNNVQLELWVRGDKPRGEEYSNVLSVSFFPEKQERDIVLVEYSFETN